MTLIFINSFRSEWLKKKRTASSWLVVLGSFFIPLILLIARLVNHESLASQTAEPEFWDKLLRNNWQFMAILLLPMGVILVTSLITQLEYRNNTWKQLYTTPQHYTAIFFSKLLLIFVMMFQFFILFNLAVFITGMIPSLFLSNVPFPVQSFPVLKSIQFSFDFFVCCLPIIAFQYLLGLQFRNFLVSIGTGIGMLVAALIAAEWKYGYTIPYTYCMQEFLGGKMTGNGMNIHHFAWAYFSMFTIAGYILYIRKKEKG